MKDCEKNTLVAANAIVSVGESVKASPSVTGMLKSVAPISTCFAPTRSARLPAIVELATPAMRQRKSEVTMRFSAKPEALKKIAEKRARNPVDLLRNVA